MEYTFDKKKKKGKDRRRQGRERRSRGLKRVHMS